MIFSVLFLAIELGVFLISIFVIAGAWDLEGTNDTVAGITFLLIGLGFLAFYWWMVTYLARSTGDG